jgi:hypothetical protein
MTGVIMPLVSVSGRAVRVAIPLASSSATAFGRRGTAGE